MMEFFSALLESGALPWIIGGGLGLMVLVFFRRVFGKAVHLALRTGVGLFGLFALSKLGPLIGVTLGVNLFNALTVGLLGIPGFGLLFLLQMVSPPPL